VELNHKQVIIGENNVGKTNFLRAIQLILDQSFSDNDRTLIESDFHESLIEPMINGEEIEISLEIQGYSHNNKLIAQFSDAVISDAPPTLKFTYLYAPILDVDGNIVRYDVPFEKNNVIHINIVIEDIIDDIEHVLRFLFEKYFNHYYQVLLNILGEEKAGENWANLLEYGTQNRIVIALQNIGLSRHTALSIYAHGRNFLVIESGKLKNINKEGLLATFQRRSIEYDEISRML
jgi:GTPase SAR1 family protein